MKKGLMSIDQIIEMCQWKIEIVQLEMNATDDKEKLKRYLEKRDTLNRVVEDLKNILKSRVPTQTKNIGS